MLNLQRTVGSGKITISDVLRLLDQSEGLQGEIKRLGEEIGADLDGITNLLLNANRKLSGGNHFRASVAARGRGG